MTAKWKASPVGAAAEARVLACSAGYARGLRKSTAVNRSPPEEHPQRPINPYGSSKLFVERMLADLDRAYGLRWIALRYFNAAGAVRDYIHVSDIAGAHVRALEHLLAGGKSAALNLANARGDSIKEVIRHGRIRLRSPHSLRDCAAEARRPAGSDRRCVSLAAFAAPRNDTPSRAHKQPRAVVRQFAQGYMLDMAEQLVFDKLTYMDRLTRAGISEEQARAQAEALHEALRESVATQSFVRQEIVATQSFVRQEIVATQSFVRDEIAAVRQEITVVRQDIAATLSLVRQEIAAVRKRLSPWSSD